MIRPDFPRRVTLSTVARLACWAGALLLAMAALDAHAPVQHQAEADAGTPDEPVRVDTHRGEQLAIRGGRTMPARPEEWQKVPPCLPDTEEAVQGACYVRAARKPPCSPALYEHAGACFVAVARAARPNTSVEE